LVGAVIGIVLIGIATAGVLSSGVPPPSGNIQYFTIEVIEGSLYPQSIEVTKGQIVLLHVQSDNNLQEMFTIVIPGYGISEVTGMYKWVQFTADKTGTFNFYLEGFPSALGELVVTE
jgi:plastocyanin domain-containing protein